jgi:hypothetical protein
VDYENLAINPRSAPQASVFDQVLKDFCHGVVLQLLQMTCAVAKRIPGKNGGLNGEIHLKWKV